MELSTSWVGVTALTGLPIMLGGLAGLKSLIVSQVIGKRPVYLVSSLLLLLSAFWTMHVTGNYSEFLVSRALSGLSWGMFEPLVLLSVKDMYFVSTLLIFVTCRCDANFFLRRMSGPSESLSITLLTLSLHGELQLLEAMSLNGATGSKTKL